MFHLLVNYNLSTCINQVVITLLRQSTIFSSFYQWQIQLAAKHKCIFNFFYLPLLNLDLKWNYIAKIILVLKNSWVYHKGFQWWNACRNPFLPISFPWLVVHGIKFFRNPWFTQIHRWEGIMFTHLSEF